MANDVAADATQILPSQPSDLSASDLLVPIVVSTTGFHGEPFQSEITLSNRGGNVASIDLTYSAVIGSGSGTVQDHLASGQQRIIQDSVAYLRNLGLPISTSGNHGGPLRVQFSGLHSGEGAVTVRTMTPMTGGRIGVSYSGVPREFALTTMGYVCGLRQNGQDRSNLAVQNVGSWEEGDITLLTTVYNGDNSAISLQPQLAFETVLAPGGFQQFSGILNQNGIDLSNGFARVEKVGGTPFYIYGVINDQLNSDGSFISPITDIALKGHKQLTLPVILESGLMTSELTLTNLSNQKKQIQCSFVAESIASPDSTASLLISLEPWQQIVLPQVVQYFRERTSQIGSSEIPFVGPLIIKAASGTLDGITRICENNFPG